MRVNISLMTGQKLLEFGRDVVILLSDSADIAPSHYNLFWSLENSPNEKKKTLISWTIAKGNKKQLFSPNNKMFQEDKIMKLPAR